MGNSFQKKTDVAEVRSQPTWNNHFLQKQGSTLSTKSFNTEAYDAVGT